MDIISRTCANCAAFMGGAAGEPITCISGEPITCMNLVSFIISPTRSRDPVSTDTCHEHMTQKEYDDGSGFERSSRNAIECSIKAQTATQELLEKLRKAGDRPPPQLQPRTRWHPPGH